MNDTLDKKIFEKFIKVITEKKLLSEKNINELKSYINKSSITAEDWDLLIDKECFPPLKEVNNDK